MNEQVFGAMGQFMSFLFGFGGLALIFAVYAIFTYNGIIGTKNKTEEAFSAIDTVLQNRYNLIPNLVEIVKQYASHETAIFAKVSEARSQLLANANKGTKEQFQKENELQGAMKSVFAIAESYPDLKASANFMELQTQWAELEDRLQAARRAYNAAVKALKDKKEMFPSNIVAMMMTIKEYAMFEADEAAKVEKIDAKALFQS